MTLPPKPTPPSTDASQGASDRERTATGARRAGLSARARAGGQPTQRKRSPKAFLISIGVHVVVAAVLVQLITFGHGMPSFFNFGGETAKEERVTFVATEPPQQVAEAAPEPVTTPQPAVRAPTMAPVNAVGAPANVPPASPARADTGSGGRADGTGNGVGEINPNLKGVQPAFGDVRVWKGAAGNGVAPGRDGAERLDSIMGYVITSARDSLDSLARAQGKYGRAPGDWTTTDKDGKKWGWDKTGIRLGKVVIPNALLSLLPLNAQGAMSGNYTEFEREKRLSLSRADIMRMSERSMGEAEFKKLANELRDRRERERRDRLKAPTAPVAPVPVTNPPKSGDKSNR